MAAMTRYLLEREQSRLLATVKACSHVLARRDYQVIRYLRGSGLRIGEFSLTTCRAARFAIEYGWHVIPKENRKGKRKGHEAPIGRDAIDALKELLKIHAEMGGDGADDSILVRSRQGPMSIRSFEDRIGMWCKRAGIPGGSPHWLRHTRAMNLIRRSEARDPRGVVQASLGHASIATTGIYTGVTREELLEAVARADGGAKLTRAQARRQFAVGGQS